MPELPEVVVTLQGVLPYILGKKISHVTIRNGNLRWPVPKDLSVILNNRKLESGRQRSKYMLFRFPHGHMMIHLGMSGNLRVLPDDSLPEKHDHVDIFFDNKVLLRYSDPRRFGSILWVEGNPEEHKLLRNLGPEPFSAEFDASRLYSLSRGKVISVKQFLMDNKNVVGVGNIYANEALFLGGINPKKAAGRISFPAYGALVFNIIEVLSSAIEQGGTTLQDFSGNDGKSGYFKQELYVYGRGGKPCLKCTSLLREIRLGQRSSVYCSTCQK